MSEHPPGSDAEAADRQRVLDIALTRRPDLSLAELHRSLDAVGLDVDTDRLLVDLDALGFEVEDVSSADSPAAPASPTAAAVAPGADLLADEPVPVAAGTIGPPAGTDRAEPWWQGRNGVVALAGAILVAALVVVFVLSRPSDDDTTTGTGDPTTTAPISDGVGPTSASAPTGPIVTAPVGPGEDQELTGGVDGSSPFDEAVSDGLGTAPDGSEWNLQSGSWTVADGVARLTGIDGEEGTGVATFDPGLGSYRLQVRLADLSNGNGLVFGVSGPDDYWALVAAPRFSTFVLVQVVDGELQDPTNSSLTTTQDGRAVVGVHVTPGQVEALVNGAVVITQELPDGLATAMGIGSAAGGQGGGFDEVSYRADP